MKPWMPMGRREWLLSLVALPLAGCVRHREGNASVQAWGVKEQPGVRAGERTWCLVSGVVITAGETGKASRKLGDREFWFCLDADDRR